MVRRARSPRQLQAAKLLPRWRRDPIFCPSLTTSSGYTSRADKICNVMSLDEPASNSKSAPVEITEGRSERHMPVLTRLDEPSSFFLDEAALYDRQIRLWGLEAQQRSVSYPSTHLSSLWFA